MIAANLGSLNTRRPVCFTYADYIHPYCGHESDNSADSHGRGHEAGVVLVVVSGEPRQALLTWLSGYMVDLPPLPTDALRVAVAAGLRTHYKGVMGWRVQGLLVLFNLMV